VTKVSRGGYIFITWKADHPPRHVHVLRNGRLVLKWNLESRRSMQGFATGKLLALIRQLEDEGLL
jgi:hypothetical protein